MTPLRTAARSLLAGTFVAGGARALANPEPFVARAKPVTDRIAPLLERAAPWAPTRPAALVRINGGVQLLGGLMLAAGRFRRVAAVALAGSLVPTTFAAHRFWETDDPDERRNQRTHFAKNLGLLGGLVLAAVDTEGRPGLAWRTRHAASHARRGVGRTARTAKREARIARKAAAAGRRFG